ncbi:MAG TPA: lipocalin family protein [Paludibacter sp.]|nr:lipocalin family protein [Paludibacter sp.]
MNATLKSLFMSISCILCLNACAKIPEGAQVVKSFDAQKYLGKWYEIARFDFRFERNLDHTTATYSMNEDGTIKVDNEGYNYVKKKRSQAIGKAKFRGDKTEAALKVSFFGPFYAPYNVIALDSEYKYALIAGKNLKYLWILSREKTIPEEIKQAYLKQARDLGFDLNKLIWVNQD